ncbi:hypothetical protein [Marinicellulosiphila megalodicopiae]|uniref:hypothetical protein n=1 Tax=Marinicellulosiphila megalodicopiae TaxID=2724896 RepID=UPI003BB0A058
MEIIQKKKSNKNKFTFKDETLNFEYSDKTGSGDIDVNYADIPKKFSILIERNEWLRNVGLLWCAIGAVQLGYAILTGSSIEGKGVWLFLGLGCVAWAHFSTIRYSVFKTPPGTIFVIHDKNHELIVDELYKRRQSQMLNWYGPINPNNELAQEIGKYKWLVEEAVLSQIEADQKIAEAELMCRESESDERLN